MANLSRISYFYIPIARLRVEKRGREKEREKRDLLSDLSTCKLFDVDEDSGIRKDCRVKKGKRRESLWACVATVS